MLHYGAFHIFPLEMKEVADSSKHNILTLHPASTGLKKEEIVIMLYSDAYH